MNKNQIYLTIEIPEFDEITFTEKFTFIRITGIESEKPILRLNNYLFEGKWFHSPASTFVFSKEKINLFQSEKKTFSIDFFCDKKLKNLQQKFKILNSEFLSEPFGFFLYKRLRLHRIPLVFLKN
ncbi:hypothetical protein CMESO_241 (nucleomorph) [Chroomonas mesostigmatica CCMP1168]|uniref:Transcription factor TFIIIC triple barrel domain-containing protein n=1 Tax=Chroomonas mesostigmatica CCMP1168 TaxID=1195612 RepID=J7G303_9CRYP|nr:hypothetical protein CMESO_241 [Chroomonas mesostigmatica CCMP1168]|mmetsp:Transcript_65860/g.162126  ORF Transcript_65860/g.162126 Transcript_65860/m.162126 type:complete len:125 (+) Transcript_65860:3827-4201(+)